MLHVLNGDAVAGRMRACGLPGERSVWAEVLHEGPIPPDLSPETWRPIRAGFYADSGMGTIAGNLERLASWDASLERAADHDEIILWFEDDLFDQLLLIRHLTWFDRNGLPARRLWLVDLPRPEAPAVARDPASERDHFERLLHGRVPVTRRQVEAAKAAWAAFAGDDPRRVEAVRHDPRMTELPHLAAALTRHLEEFPGPRDGLGRIERTALRCLAESGPLAPAALFVEVARVEERPFLGDCTFYWLLNALRRGEALVAESGPDHALHITETGREVLAGAVDRVPRHGIDRWRGGVHLLGRAVAWRWDPDARRLVA
jgi:hypothetical protein